MKELGLQDLLRYGLSGGIGLVVLLLTYPESVCSMSHLAASLGKPENTLEVTLILGLVLVIGTVIYSIHRAVIYPFFFWCLLGLFTKRPRCPLRPSKFERDLDRWRSGLCDLQRRNWGEWGAQTHSLYCAAWAIASALILGLFFWNPPNRCAFYLFLLLFGVTLVAAVVTNYRLLYSITYAKRRKDKKVPTC